jgi:hypothetical protein
MDNPPLLTNDNLAQYSIFVVPSLAVPICTACGIAVVPEHTRKHIMEKHVDKQNSQKRAIPPQSFFSDALHCLGAVAEPIIPSSPIAPIPTLPLRDGWVCLEGSCRELMVSTSSLNRHFNEAHPRVKTRRTRPATVHRLFEFRGAQKLVEVDKCLSAKSRPQSLAEYLKQLDAGESYDDIFELPSGNRCLSHFLTYTKWGTVIEGFAVTDLIGLVALPEKDDALFPLRSGAKEYINYIAALLPRAHDTFLTALMGADE